MEMTAYGRGHITFRAGTVKEYNDVCRLIENTWPSNCFNRHGGDVYSARISSGGRHVGDMELYDEYQVIDTLNALASRTVEGDIRYFGENGDKWRFVFDQDSRTWNQEEGQTVFTPSLEGANYGLLKSAAAKFLSFSSDGSDVLPEDTWKKLAVKYAETHPDFLREMALEHEKRCHKEDLLNYLEEKYDLGFLPEEKKESITEKALPILERYLGENVHYGEIYHDMVGKALSEV